jgi:hypothetical protein
MGYLTMLSSSFLTGMQDECEHGIVGVQHAKGTAEEDERHENGVAQMT